MFLRISLSILVSVIYLSGENRFEQSITPSKVYKEVTNLHEEINLIKEHFNKKAMPTYVDIKTKLLPRHAWQRTYEIFVKINILREKYNLPIIEPVNMEPTLELDPTFTYEQVLRLLQEVRILKLRFGITKKIETQAEYSNKTPSDVYNALNLLSRELDIINGKEFTPSHVFAEVIRIYEDFDAILNRLKITNPTTPPIKNQKDTPTQSYHVALELLESIRKLELSVGLQSVDFYAFRRKKINPSDVFEITQIILAELQLFKAYIGLHHTITRGAKRYHNKTPADVTQMMRWLLKKSKQINLLTYKR